ncbi:MAG: Holliday junction resolvase RuvX [Bacilli bacterium]
MIIWLNNMRYLGIDLGSRRMGVSLSDPTGIIAAPLIVVNHVDNYPFLVDEIKKIVKDNKVDEIVLGFPKNMNNTIGEKGELSIWFKKELEEKLEINVHLIDERLSTKSANDILINNNTRRNKRKKVIDKMAAVIILQSFLDRI